MRLRMLVGAAMVVAVCAMSAAPAMALFAGTPGEGLAGEGVFTLETGKSVSCTSAKTTTVVNNKTSLNLGTITWNSCTATVGEAKLSAVVTCNNLVLEQPTKEGTSTGKATGKVVSECTIVLTGASCTIVVPITGNQGLGKVALKKEASGVLGITEVSPIKATVKGAGCSVAGLVGPFNAASLKIPSLKGAGLSLE